MKGRPLFIPLASIIAGLLYAGLYHTFVPPQVLLPLLFVSLLAVFLPYRLPFLLSVSLLFFCWGNVALHQMLNPESAPNHIISHVSEIPMTVEGVVDSRPQATDKGWRVYLDTERLYDRNRATIVSGRILVYVGEGRPEVATGDRVRFISRLHKPRNYGLPGEFDYVRYLAVKGVHVTAFVGKGEDVVLVRAKAGHFLQRAMDEAAAGMGSFIGKAVPSVEGGVLRALLLGERGYVPPYLESAYAATGVNHILSISGFHVGIIALFVFNLLLGICRNFQILTLNFNLRKSLLVVTLPLMVFYLLLSGTAPATARSVIMIAAVVIALMVEREVDTVNSLLLAALVILAVTPGALFDVSFQLSFVALWGIIVLTPVFTAPFSRYLNGSLLHKVLLLIAASLAAIFATIFPVAFYFHRVSLTGVLGNLVVVPLMGYGAVVLGFSALPFIYLLPSVAKLLLVAASYLVKIADWFVLLLSRVPAYPFINPDRFDLLIFYLLLLVLTLVSSKTIRVSLSIIALFALCGNALFYKKPDKELLQVTFFSVGQGESTLIRFPGGKTMLVDGGGPAREGGADVGERLLAPALWSMGVTSIDYLVLTHAHPDHIQGLLYIADNFHVGEFWESGSADDGEYYRTLRDLLARRQIPVRALSGASPQMEVGEARLKFLWPQGATPKQPLDDNDNSLVFRLAYGSGSILFTGDIGSGVESAIAAKGIRSTVLKVPHHGSRYSSSEEFIQEAAPEIALIAAGYGNSFHLPAEQTLARLERNGAQIYRTDRDGTIDLAYDPTEKRFVLRPRKWHFN